MKFTLRDLQKMPTLNQGHFDNLKIETNKTRVWLSRCTVEDGEPYNNKVTIERLNQGNWVIADTFEAKPTKLYVMDD